MKLNVKYINSNFLDTPEIRFATSIVSRKKVEGKEEEIDLVYQNKSGVVISSTLYLLFSFKTEDGVYKTAYISYGQLRAVKKIVRALADGITDKYGKIVNTWVNPGELRTDHYGNNLEAIAFEYLPNFDGVLIKFLDSSGNKITASKVTAQQFLALDEALNQINLVTMQLSAGLAYASDIDGWKVDKHVSPRYEKATGQKVNNLTQYDEHEKEDGE
jgi:hypothetical protein